MSADLIDRRSFLEAAVLAGAGLGALLAGCASPPAPRPTTAPDATSEPTTMPTSRPTTLLAYFSRPGENYWYGGRRDLATGNTEVLATMIAARIECDVYRIEAADPYPTDYEATVARNVREQDDDTRPAIAGALPDVTGYTTVILASPIWNVRPPMIMSTFVESVGLGRTTVLPVTTHAMSGLGRSVEVYTDLAPEATIGEGLAVRGEEVGDAGNDVDTFLASALTR